MQIGLNDFEINYKRDKARTRIQFLVAMLLLLLVCLFSLCLRTDGKGFISLIDVFENIKTFIRLTYAQIFKLPLYLQKQDIISSLNYYEGTINSLNAVFVTIVCGAILSISGAAYQGVFRNPIASPAMLGVTSGVNLGLLLLLIIHSEAALYIDKERYAYTYFCGLSMVLIIILAGRLMGKNKVSVTDMLLVGAIFSQLANLVTSYFRFTLPVEKLQTLQNFTVGRLSALTGYSLYVFLLVSAIGLIPILLLRNSINAMCFGDEECRALGLNPNKMRIVILLSSTLLVAASVIHFGGVGLISLIVPHICRYIFGSNFKQIYPASTILGAIVLLIARDISTVLSALYGYIPVSVFISLIGTPMFMYLLVKQRRGWE